MDGLSDITAIMTAHSEGVLAGPSVASFDQAIAAARSTGLTVESVIVLDRPDPATHAYFEQTAARHRLIVTDEGDPGQARNAGVASGTGAFVSFLDADDLWCEDWLVLAHRFCSVAPDTTIAHSEVNVVFGAESKMWFHVDSRDPTFDTSYLGVGNYWDALSFAAREIYRHYPFRANDLPRGFAHEDWHWNCVTLGAGLHHRPVPGTTHFKRRRKASQMTLCDGVQALPWMSPLLSYDVLAPADAQTV
jgi:glycosyltransferase involved in cell wall biosynthesis